VSQGVHLQMCGEVLRYLGSDTCFHIRTSPLWLAQWRYPGCAQRRYRIQHYVSQFALLRIAAEACIALLLFKIVAFFE